MQDQLENRLQQLRSEYAKGEEQLATLEREARTLRDMLLRISGGIQVLEEELKANAESESGTGSPSVDLAVNGQE